MQNGITINTTFYPSNLFSFSKDNPLGNIAQSQEIFSFLCAWFSAEPFIEAQTSGSTGKPKNVLLHKTYLINSALATLKFLKLNPTNSAILALPVKFIAGKMMLVRAIVGKLNLFSVEPSVHPAIFDANFIALTPMQVDSLLQKKALNFSGKIIIGGGQLNQSLANKLLENKLLVFETFGMTETLSHIALKNISVKDNFFTCLPNVSIAVYNNNLLQINAPDIGVNNLKTNDVIEFINETCFRWIGRADFVINSGGVKVHPEKLEQSFNNLFKENFFFGALPHPKFGDALCLFVEKNEETKLESIETILQENKHLLPFSLYRVILCTNFIYTGSNKINRFKTIEQYA